MTWKRGLAALGIVMTGAAALILAFAPNFFSVLFAQILQGATAGVLTPAIGAISLGLVGRAPSPCAPAAITATPPPATP